MLQQEMSFQEKLSITKKARKITSLSFEKFCENLPITPEQLILWLDAFKAGGEMGLRALEETINPPQDKMERAIGVIKLYLDYKFPHDNFNIKKRKNKIIISKIFPQNTNSQTKSSKHIFQIKYFETKSRKALWLLFWMRDDGKWWPYITKKQRIYKIDHLMEEVVNDEQNRFWNK